MVVDDMLSEAATNGTDETVVSTGITVATHDTSGPNTVRREYTFSYAKEWDEWMFHHYVESEKTEDNTYEEVDEQTWYDGQPLIPPVVFGQLYNFLADETVEKLKE